MTPWFADTFFFLALLNAQDDKFHGKARAANRVDRPVVTSDWVLLELADHLCDARNRHLFGELLDAVRRDRRYEIINADADLLADAVALYREREDKDWSLTDCTSFLIMNRRGLTEALTADHHFEQAGFVTTLK